MEGYIETPSPIQQKIEQEFKKIARNALIYGILILLILIVSIIQFTSQMNSFMLRFIPWYILVGGFILILMVATVGILSIRYALQIQREIPMEIIGSERKSFKFLKNYFVYLSILYIITIVIYLCVFLLAYYYTRRF